MTFWDSVKFVSAISFALLWLIREITNNYKEQALRDKAGAAEYESWKNVSHPS